MIRLDYKFTCQGVDSFDVYLDDLKLDCSIISSSKFPLKDGKYRLSVGLDQINIHAMTNGAVVGTISAGNGLFNVKSCKLFIGDLVSGILCVRGKQHFEEMKKVLRRVKYDQRVLVINSSFASST